MLNTFKNRKQKHLEKTNKLESMKTRIDILKQKGYSNSAISETLGISESSVLLLQKNKLIKS